MASASDVVLSVDKVGTLSSLVGLAESYLAFER